MSESILPQTKPVTLHATLACRLRPRQLHRGFSPLAGEVELENTSSRLMEIEVRTSPLQYLDLIVTDSGGNVVSDSFYGDQFSPVAEPYTLRIRPGEKFTAPVSLLGNAEKARCRPGVYLVQAVFAYNGLRAVSDPLRLELEVAEA